MKSRDISKLRSELSEKEDCSGFVGYIQKKIRDEALSKTSGGEASDLIGPVQMYGQSLQAEERLLTHANPSLILENMMAEIYV